MRRLLNSEPPEALEAFRELTGEALDTWDNRTPGLLDDMPSARHLQAELTDTDVAVAGGETFVARFYQTEQVMGT